MINSKPIYRELRCQCCNRKLAEAQGKYIISIRCRRCGSFNRFQAA
ncbi:MAG: Com family DNA-binding transcriptional regulator [Eikenella corrodens]